MTANLDAAERRSSEDGHDADYWDEVAELWSETAPQGLWRAHSDAVNEALFRRWLPVDGVGRLLKTDIFDEAVSAGLLPRLPVARQWTVGIDVSAAALRSARRRYPNLLAVCSDVRRLPFADATFDAVISNSTLDHFAAPAEIATALRELHRVLTPGGCLLVTLDNRANPIIALRAFLPFRLLNRLGVVPYYVGPTYGPADLRRALVDAGFDVRELGAVMHCPRVVAVAAARIVERHTGPATQRRFLQGLMRFERLSGWPTRFRTGYFVAARATRR